MPSKIATGFILDERVLCYIDVRGSWSKIMRQQLTICILTVSIAYAILPALVMDAWFQKEPITMDMKTIRQEKLQYTSVKTRCASGIDHQEGDVMRSTILSE
uniref:Uncharacterized protein n=1 Tax=Salix viminalis TaxID=40686 RepID=A0A6N2JYA7_SALVM